MSRSPNKVKSTRVSFNPAAQVAEYLDELVEVGLYGTSRSAVAESLVTRELERLIREKILVLRMRKAKRQ